MRILVFLSLFFLSLFGGELKIATFNVENLFDGVENGSEYKDYKSSRWNEEKYLKKLSNIGSVIRAINADVIGVEEIENHGVLQSLAKRTDYKYFAFATLNDKSPVGLGIMSRYPINKKEIIKIPGVKTRPILNAKINFENNELSFYIAHFPAYKNPYKYRQMAAKTMIKIASNKNNSIIMGDLNSNYDKDFLLEDLELSYVDLWTFTPAHERKSHKKGGAIDHIMLSKDFFENKNLNYKSKSFKVLRNLGVQNNSDHYPIAAVLTTNSDEKFNISKNTSSYDEITVDDIYKTGAKNKILEGVICFKDKNGFSICDKNGRGIYVFNNFDEVSQNDKIKILVKDTKFYRGNLEVNKYKILNLAKFNGDLSKFTLKDLTSPRPGDVILDFELDIKDRKAKFAGKEYLIFAPDFIIKNGKIKVSRAMFWTYKNKDELIIKMERK